MLKDDSLFAEIEADWRTAQLSEKRRAMVDYAVKLTHSPGQMTKVDVIALRSADFSDRDILDIVEVTGYYAYVNRIADGLGVPIEDWVPDDV